MYIHIACLYCCNMMYRLFYHEKKASGGQGLGSIHHLRCLAQFGNSDDNVPLPAWIYVSSLYSLKLTACPYCPSGIYWVPAMCWHSRGNRWTNLRFILVSASGGTGHHSAQLASPWKMYHVLSSRYIVLFLSVVSLYRLASGYFEECLECFSGTSCDDGNQPIWFWLWFSSYLCFRKLELGGRGWGLVLLKNASFNPFLLIFQQGSS